MTTETHNGGCHCGAVRFKVDIDLSQPVIDCNCSVCRMKGHLLSFVPGAAFTLERGDDNLTTYRFASNAIGHQFCKTCGVQCFATFEDGGRTINVRTLDGADLAALTLMPFDGASR